MTADRPSFMVRAVTDRCRAHPSGRATTAVARRAEGSRAAGLPVPTGRVLSVPLAVVWSAASPGSASR